MAKEKVKKPVITEHTERSTKTQKKQKLSSSVNSSVGSVIARKNSPRSAAGNKLHADVYDINGKVVESMLLPEHIFGVKSNPRLVAQAVRIYLANQRTGSASTKTRGEVEGSTRKIYRQKGTGRARHGGVRAPIFVHGGIAHGPKPRDFSLDLPKKMKRAALIAALSDKVREGVVKIISGVEKIEPKTKPMASLLSKLLDGKKTKTLLVLGEKQENIIRSVRNIEGVTYGYARQLHTYEVMQHDAIIFLKNALEEIEKTQNKKGKK